LKKETKTDNKDKKKEQEKETEKEKEKKDEKKSDKPEKNNEEDDLPGKKDPEHISLGNIYSEESRDIVCQMQLPKISEDHEKFHVATVELKYFNVITNQYEVVSSPCYIRRSHAAKKSQTRDVNLDKQINRLLAARAMEEAHEIGKSDLPKGRKVISDAILLIKESISAGDALSQELVSDLEEILADMKDSVSYEKKAAKKMAWKGDAHQKQRAVGKAGGSYQTSAKQKMQDKSAMYTEKKEAPKKSSKPMSKTKSKSDAKDSGSENSE